jgi:tRNA-binding protein
MKLIDYQQFSEVEIRCGTVVKTEEFPRTKKPAYKVWVDFGPEIGVKQTSAQVTVNYTVENLIGMQVCGAINLGTKNIAGFTSEFLLLGFEDKDGNITLVGPKSEIPNGKKLY